MFTKLNVAFRNETLKISWPSASGRTFTERNEYYGRLKQEMYPARWELDGRIPRQYSDTAQTILRAFFQTEIKNFGGPQCLVQAPFLRHKSLAFCFLSEPLLVHSLFWPYFYFCFSPPAIFSDLLCHQGKVEQGLSGPLRWLVSHISYEMANKTGLCLPPGFRISYAF